MLEWIAFVVLGATLLTAGWKVVTSRDLVHSVLWLGLTLAATAGLFVTLHAEFLAAVQILLYTGGVVTLMIFGIMLTRRLSSVHIEHGSTSRARAFALALAALALVVFGVSEASRVGYEVGGSDAGSSGLGDTQALGSMVLRDLVLPFEVLSILLLAAMIGAIVLARKVDP